MNGKLQTPFFDEFDYYSIMNSDPLIHLNAPLMVPKVTQYTNPIINRKKNTIQ